MPPADAPTDPGPGPAPQAGPGNEDTLDLRLTAELLVLLGEEALAHGYGPEPSGLLDRPAEWKPVTTPLGVFQLVPVRLERDLAVISRWMNDPAVAAFWELAGAETVTAAHLMPQLEGDGRSIPCLGVLSGVPMSYWEIYRADLDPWPDIAGSGRTTPGSTSSSATWNSGATGSGRRCSGPSPISSSTTALGARGSSPSPTSVTPRPSPPS